MITASQAASARAPAGRAVAAGLAILATTFFMWGFVTVLNDVLVPHLKSVFELNYTQTLLIQFVFFGTYFILALPGAKLIEWVGYNFAIVAAQSLRATRPGGQISLIDLLAGAAASNIPLVLAVMRKVRLQSVTLGSAAEFGAMLRTGEAAELRPALDSKRYNFHDADKVIASLAAGEHFGKVVVEYD